AVGMLAACGSSKSSTSSSTPSPSSPSAVSSPAVTNLAGSAWTMTSYADTSGTMVAAAQSAALSFGANGALSGSTGCNSFRGTYTSTGSSLTLTLGPMTQMACVDAAATAQETAVVQQLPEVASYTTGGDGLTLSASDGSPLFVYAAANTNLPGTSWQVTGVNN